MGLAFVFRYTGTMSTLLLHEIYEEAAKLPEADQKRLAERWQRDLLLRQPNNLRLVESSATVPADEPVASPMEESATQPPEEGTWARIAREMGEEAPLKGYSEHANTLFRQFRDHFTF